MDVHKEVQTKMKALNIGEVARRAGVGIETIRFYERGGLIADPTRKESGYRQYSEEVVSRLRFIKRAQELGFPLKEIKELLSLRIDPQTDCADIQKHAEAKIRDIEGKIRTLQRMKKTLAALAAACPGRGPVSDCPILEALDNPMAGNGPPSKRPAAAHPRAGKGGNHVSVLPRLSR